MFGSYITTNGTCAVLLQPDAYFFLFLRRRLQNGCKGIKKTLYHQMYARFYRLSRVM